MSYEGDEGSDEIHEFDVGIVVIVGIEVLDKSYHHLGIDFRQVYGCILD